MGPLGMEMSPVWRTGLKVVGGQRYPGVGTYTQNVKVGAGDVAWEDMMDSVDVYTQC